MFRKNFKQISRIFCKNDENVQLIGENFVEILKRLGGKTLTLEKYNYLYRLNAILEQKFNPQFPS